MSMVMQVQTQNLGVHIVKLKELLHVSSVSEFSFGL